jgi:hypothetical protein
VPGDDWTRGNVAAPVAIATVNKNISRHAHDVMRISPTDGVAPYRGSDVFPIRN